MHEASLVLAMCEEIENLARREGAKKVLRIVVSFGEYAGVEEEAFRFAFEALKEGSPLFKEATLEIKKTKARYRCPLCQEEFSPEDEPLCPRCHLPGLPHGGGELELKKVEFLTEG